MSYDIFLKIDGIDGESMDDKHKNEIEVLSWRWNMARVPVRRAGIILPFSAMKSRKVSMSL